MEGMTKKHFGDEFDLDKLFNLLSKKFEKSFSTFDPDKAITLFILLKRKDSNWLANIDVVFDKWLCKVVLLLLFNIQTSYYLVALRKILSSWISILTLVQP